MKIIRLLPFRLVMALQKRRRRTLYPDSSDWLAFTKAFFDKLIQNTQKRTMIEFLIAGADSARSFEYRAETFDSWPGQTLILSSVDDKGSYTTVEELAARYPRARTHIFKAGMGGHHTFLLFPEEYAAVLKGFLDEVLS